MAAAIILQLVMDAAAILVFTMRSLAARFAAQESWVVTASPVGSGITPPAHGGENGALCKRVGGPAGLSTGDRPHLPPEPHDRPQFQPPSSFHRR
ncbi:Hypothetical predicted protein, partial [Pelobates cultripes]